MGNVINTAVTLGIKLDGDEQNIGKIPVANAGERLSGLVFADVPVIVRARSLILEVRGEEIGKTRHQSGNKFVQRPIVTLTLNLREFQDQRLLRGKYEFPFCIDLPAGLPSSTSVFKSTKSWCEVKYTLRALLVGVRAGKNTVSDRPLFVFSAPTPPAQVPFVVEPVTSIIRNTVGVSKGSITFGLRVADTHVGRDEEIELELACRNNSTVDIERVQVKVKEICEWKVNSWKESTVETLVTNPSISVPAGLGKKSRTELKESKKAGIDPQQEHYLDIFGEITSRNNIAKLKIPTNARDTFKGQVMNVKHILIVKIKTGWGVDDPNVEILLKIGSPAVDDARMPSVRLPPPVPLPPPGEDVPVAVALPVGWSGAEQSLRIIAPPEAIVVGGSVRSFSESNTDTASIPVPALVPPPEPTLEHLFSEMVSSVDDYGIISAKLEDSDWRQLFISLSPESFGSIISHVNQDFDQPRVAALVAPVISNGEFSCDHCAAAVRSCVAWNRVALVQQLLPFCTDIVSRSDVIRSELTEWENVVTSKDFEHAKGTFSGA